MIFFSILFGFLLAQLCGASALIPRGGASAQIVGGRPAKQGEIRWIVSIQRNGGHFCAGSLYTPRYIITAAHCMQGQDATKLTVRGGSLDKSSGGTVIAGQSIVIHPQYKQGTQDYDIAILKLVSPFDFRGALLAFSGQDPASGVMTSVAGWGTTTEGGQTSRQLQIVDIPIVDRKTCNSQYSGGITDRMFCAGQAGKDSCQGDSGGPLVYNSPDGPILWGIVSWGSGCARPNYPGVYGRVGVFRDFIDNDCFYD